MFKSGILNIRKVRSEANIKLFEYFGQPSQRDGGPKGRWDKGMVGQRDSGPKGQWGQRVGGPKGLRAKGTVGQRDGWKCFL